MACSVALCEECVSIMKRTDELHPCVQVCLILLSLCAHVFSGRLRLKCWRGGFFLCRNGRVQGAFTHSVLDISLLTFKTDVLIRYILCGFTGQQQKRGAVWSSQFNPPRTGDKSCRNSLIRPSAVLPVSYQLQSFASSVRTFRPKLAFQGLTKLFMLTRRRPCFQSKWPATKYSPPATWKQYSKLDLQSLFQTFKQINLARTVN